MGDTMPDWIPASLLSQAWCGGYHSGLDPESIGMNNLNIFNTAGMDQSVVKSPALSISLTLLTSSQWPFM